MSLEQKEASGATPIDSPGVEPMHLMLAAGKSLREIGKAHGVSHVTAKNRLEAAGHVMRKRGREALSISACELGICSKYLAFHYGVSESTIRAAKRRQRSTNNA